MNPPPVGTRQRPQLGELREILDIGQKIITGADRILLYGFGTSTAQEKADGTLVTEIDQAVDEHITSSLTATFPDHAILSEEAITQYDPARQYTWVIDPLDGTTNFARGLPIWGVSIALLSYGLPVLGIVSFSLLHERFTALVNGGAYLNGTIIRSSTISKADKQNFIMLCSRTPRRYRIATPLKARMFGATTYQLISVARGTALAAVEATPKIWDIAAALLILNEAGGAYSSLDQSQGIFPLGDLQVDYKQRSFPLVAAANRDLLDELEAQLVKL